MSENHTIFIPNFNGKLYLIHTKTGCFWWKLIPRPLSNETSLGTGRCNWQLIKKRSGGNLNWEIHTKMAWKYEFHIPIWQQWLCEYFVKLLINDKHAINHLEVILWCSCCKKLLLRGTLELGKLLRFGKKSNLGCLGLHPYLPIRY